MTDPTPPGVPATPVSADVPADEPVAPPPVPEVPVPPTPPEVPAPPVTPVEPATPVTPAEPATPAVPATPPTPATPEAPATPAPAPEVPAPAPPAPASEPAPAPAPEPAPAPPAPEPAPAPAPEPPTATVAAGLAAAAETTTETAPHPAVPAATDVYADVPREEPADPVRKARTRGLLIGVAATLALAGLVGAFLVKGPLDDANAERRVNDRRETALNQASQLALNLVSLNYRTLDEDLKRISDSTTGKAREEFNERILENESYKTLVKDNQAVITSKIQRIGLEECGTDDAACKRGDTATVLVFLDQESKNKLRPTPRVDRNRVVLTLVRQGEKWLVSEVKVL